MAKKTACEKVLWFEILLSHINPLLRCASNRIKLGGVIPTHLRKAAAAKRSAELSIIKAQSTKLAQKGGNLFSSLFSLAQPFVVPAAKAAAKELGKAGISFAADKILKKIFGKGYGPSEVKLYHLERRLSPEQRRTIEKYLVGQGVVHGGGSAQYGGFLGMLASIGIPLAISLVKSVLGKRMQVGPSRWKRSAPLPPPPPQSGQGIQINPPWFHRDYLHIPIKGIFSRDEVKPLHHSPCILNLDDLGSLGTHWVACWPGEDMEYFDSFGQPLEWEREMLKTGLKTFLRNENQIQTVDSVWCGYHYLLFLNERNKGKSYENILKEFSPDLRQNEELVKNYFSQKGAAIARRVPPSLRDKMAYATSMLVNPTASWGSAFKLLGSQALKGITDDIKHATSGPISSTCPYLTPKN